MDSEPTKGQSFPLKDAVFIKAKVLNWLRQFNTFCFLDSCGFPGGRFEFLAGAGLKREVILSGACAPEDFDTFLKEKDTWLLGHWSYELQTGTGLNHSGHTDAVGFPEGFFFEPEWLLYVKEGRLYIEGEDPAALYKTLLGQPASAPEPLQLQLPVQCRVTKEAYLETIRQLQAHIHRGDCYEINYCVEFFSADARMNPFDVYQQLTTRSPNPFSGLYRFDDRWLICASPERFLERTGSRLISQPIKGTLSRSGTDTASLKEEQRRLAGSSKDRAENVMVVDLVRNDLSRICSRGSVQVDELFGIYSFAQVHQMISTVSGTVDEHIRMADILRATFPMGSMTGAPKIRVMQLIDHYEKTARGIFSGALGYVQPDGNFDFNVVIRSLMYNASSRYLSYKVGSGITIYSNPELEWEECLLKAKAIEAVLEGR
ncbi:anthranilate synthase component I family protein [Niabella drilacis]|uniref:Para-aminobenzoate synthetase component 1 n=1 Tax=Niabella drilacis (strain DSM 25811 / CCM 8410 / CCUG 62505 / LMG 26954 / E90) TaxID=1285928 RepID=A0A1G6LS61_NIADE|nr:anthranilate synthase component I family protein [Niabella drilacis]SDC45934.1 para-aminobenzoate synthetase component 1 [Niabella drilacis]